LTNSELILSAQTIATDSFEERVRAAAESGCAGIGLRWVDYERAGEPDAEVRAVLAGHGVAVAEYEVLRHWAYDDERAERGRTTEEQVWRMADAFGGRHVIAIASEFPGPLELVAERLSALADRAAAHGLIAALEFLPWTEIPDAATAWEIVRLADHPQAGVLVDSWHLYRGAADERKVRAIPADRIVAVHIDDAGAEPVGTLLEDTLHRRRVPGEGVFPLVDYVRMLDEIGVSAPFGVEVLSDELHALPAVEAARRAVDATRAVLAAARTGNATADGRGSAAAHNPKEAR
jgi:sugar phosphate isomerase/epimerase